MHKFASLEARLQLCLASPNEFLNTYAGLKKI